MRLGLALLLGLLLAGAVVWWMDRGERKPSPEGVAPQAARPEGPARPVYRWRDDDGVLQVTDTPPSGRPYEKVDIPAERNIVPMTVPEPEG